MYENDDNSTPKYYDCLKESQETTPSEPLHEAKEPKSSFWKKTLASVSLGLLFGIFAGAGFFAVQQGYRAAGKNAEPQAAVSEKVTDSNGFNDIASVNTNNVTVVSSDVSGVVEQVMPAMVSIVNDYTASGTTFFGQPYTQPGTAGGSGIIIAQNDEELLIATNYHVIENADKLTVTFTDGEEAEASIKGTDSDMDLAVIAIPLDKLKAETKAAISVATLGDSDSLKLGEPVIAIGNALGYGQSVTDGIVSALNREITMNDGSKRTFIQTNAAINHGNSGGALLNMKGEVIGINSNKLSGNDIESMGYAIPISAAHPIIADLMEHQTRNKVEEKNVGYIGITPQEVTPEIAQMFKMPQGVYVASVLEGAPAEKAGILSGDILVKFDGQKITGTSDLFDILQYYAAGSTAKLTIMRPQNGEYVTYEIEVTLATRPEYITN